MVSESEKKAKKIEKEITTFFNKISKKADSSTYLFYVEHCKKEDGTILIDRCSGFSSLEITGLLDRMKTDYINEDKTRLVK